MKKRLTIVAVFVMCLGFWGCQEQAVVFQEPTFTEGSLLSDHLLCESGNYDRANNTGRGSFLEIESGYYILWQGNLCYAEKGNENAWYYVCPKANCGHGMGCSSQIRGNGIAFRNGRIYFAASIENYPQYSNNGKTRGVSLFSMEPNGADTRLEHQSGIYIPKNGGGESSDISPTGYVIGGYAFNEDGAFSSELYWIDEEGTVHQLMQKTTDEQPPSAACGFARRFIGMYGDQAFLSCATTFDRSYVNQLCWLNDGQLIITDISELPGAGGYLHGNILRGFKSNDGYYDFDLLTGQRVMLEKAQLKESGSAIIQPNCIIESTLLKEDSHADQQEMRFFDGQQWHVVELPEALQQYDPTFEIVALTSDRIIFSVKRYGSITDYYGEDSSVILYRMDLGEKDYQVTYMGTFTMPAA